jgi:RNA polymerase sigma-54 factor
MTLIASDVSPVDRLMADVATIVDAGDCAIAEFLLHSLDDRGYLLVHVEEVATRFGCPIDVVEAVLSTIQQIAPPGVGARSVRECLLLQLDARQRQGGDSPPAHTREVVADFLEDIAAHRYSRIGRRLGLTTQDIAGIHDYIRTRLTPSPLQTPDARTWRTPTQAPLVAPDVVVHLHEGEFRIEIVESRASRLRLDPMYAALAADLRQNDQLATGNERAHVRQHVSRARLFLLAVNQRHETLKRITAVLLELQRDFVLNGVRALRPLTRGQVAEAVGLHESTVSRATAGKYLMLPNREVIAYSTFFVASLSTKDIIRELIEREDNALTDEEIGRRLHAQGIRIARRTVAKYRATLGILPSTFRQSHAAAS